MTITESVALLPPEARKQEIPYLVVLHLLGAHVHKNYQGKDAFALEMDGTFYPLSTIDYEIVCSIATEISGEIGHPIHTPAQWMMVHRIACRKLAETESFLSGQNRTRKVIMLKDQGGAGYWRMVLPAKHLEKLIEKDPDISGQVSIDVTSASVKFDYLLEYDTIYVQRLHDWESFYILEKLKKAGKRIVYDIDDDIFSLTPDNPAFHVISRDNQMAAIACMKMADTVTTTTSVLQNRLAQVLDNGTYPEVIPNALDTDDRWLPTEDTGSPDGYKRIFWQGSATHEEDFQVVAGALDRIMQTHPKVRLVILGYLPKCVIQRLERGYQHWQGRVEHVGFSDTETYFEMVHHVRAEVGIAPLAPKGFNEAKSPIKILEYSCIGMPTVASAMEPYSSVINNGESGYLAQTEDEWVECIGELLTNETRRKKLLTAARLDSSECFDIKKMAGAWKEVLLP